MDSKLYANIRPYNYFGLLSKTYGHIILLSRDYSNIHCFSSHTPLSHDLLLSATIFCTPLPPQPEDAVIVINYRKPMFHYTHFYVCSHLNDYDGNHKPTGENHCFLTQSPGTFAKCTCFGSGIYALSQASCCLPVFVYMCIYI